MSNIAIMLDSSADLSVSEAKELGYYVVRMPLEINGKQYIEEIDISDKEVSDLMKAGNVVKTSQPKLGDIIEMWESLLKTYDEVIFIPLSSGLSGTYQSAKMASLEFNDKVTVIDAKSACCPIQKLAKYTKDMINLGYTSEEIKNKIESSNMFCALIPDDLAYLKRGGRISSAAAAIANVLKIVPILKVDNGVIDVLGKVRTKRKAIQFAIESVMNVDNIDDYEFIFTCADVTNIDDYVNEFENELKRKVMIGNIKSVIMAHTGPGTIGFARVKKIKY